MIGRTDLAGLADSVLDRVAGLAPDAAAEVSVLAREAGLTRFAGSYIHQNVAERELRVALRVIRDGRWTTASTDRAGAGGLDQLVKSTVDAVRLAPVDPDFPGLAAARPVAFAGNWDAATATATPADRAAVVADFVAATGSLPAAGYVQTGCRQGAFANTAGQRAAGATTHAGVDGIARTSTSDGAGRWAAVALADLSGADTGRAAAEAAAAGAEPTDLPPGDYEVVLSPACVDDLLGFLTNYGFNGRAATEGRAFVALG
jgi:predicted Zn-dependent protease